MNAFLLGFLITFLILFVTIGILRTTIPYGSKLFGTNQIPYKSFEESTDWLNFILHRVLSHFKTPESIEKINESISEKIKFAKFKLNSIGNTPQIPYVSTLNLKNQLDLKLLIPIIWEGGPSIDITMMNEKIVVEADILKFKGTVLVSWPPNNKIDVELKLVGETDIDFEICIFLWKKYRFSLTKLPVFGPIIKGIVPFILTRKFISFKAEMIIPDDVE